LRRPIPGATLSGVRRAERRLGTAEVESERKRGWLKPTTPAR
jgi:hypothetical protein